MTWKGDSTFQVQNVYIYLVLSLKSNKRRTFYRQFFSLSNNFYKKKVVKIQENLSKVTYTAFWKMKMGEKSYVLLQVIEAFKISVENDNECHQVFPPLTQFLPPGNNQPVFRLSIADRFKDVFFLCTWCFFKADVSHVSTQIALYFEGTEIQPIKCFERKRIADNLSVSFWFNLNNVAI